MKFTSRSNKKFSGNDGSVDKSAAEKNNPYLDHVSKLEQELRDYVMKKKTLEVQLSVTSDDLTRVSDATPSSKEMNELDELEHAEKMVGFLQLELENATNLATIDKKETVQLQFLEKQMELLKRTRKKIVTGKSLIDNIHLIKELSDDLEKVKNENEAMKQKVKLGEMFEQEYRMMETNVLKHKKKIAEQDTRIASLEQQNLNLSYSMKQQQSSDSCLRIAQLVGTMEQLQKEANIERQTRKEMEVLYEKLALMYKQLKKRVELPPPTESSIGHEKDEVIRTLRAKISLLEDMRFQNELEMEYRSTNSAIYPSVLSNAQNSQSHDCLSSAPPPPPAMMMNTQPKKSPSMTIIRKSVTMKPATQNDNEPSLKDLIMKTKQSLRSTGISLTEENQSSTE